MKLLTVSVRSAENSKKVLKVEYLKNEKCYTTLSSKMTDFYNYFENLSNDTF